MRLAFSVCNCSAVEFSVACLQKFNSRCWLDFWVLIGKLDWAFPPINAVEIQQRAFRERHLTKRLILARQIDFQLNERIANSFIDRLKLPAGI